MPYSLCIRRVPFGVVRDTIRKGHSWFSHDPAVRGADLDISRIDRIENLEIIQQDASESIRLRNNRIILNVNLINVYRAKIDTQMLHRSRDIKSLGWLGYTDRIQIGALVG